MKKIIYAFILVGLFILAVNSNANAGDPYELINYDNCPTLHLKCSNGYQFTAVCCDREDHIAWLMYYC